MPHAIGREERTVSSRDVRAMRHRLRAPRAEPELG